MIMPTGSEFIKQMSDAGLLPQRCKSVVLRAAVDSAITIEYECFVGKEIVEFNIAKKLVDTTKLGDEFKSHQKCCRSQ